MADIDKALPNEVRKEFEVPGNLFLAISRESITSDLSICSLLDAYNELGSY